MSLEIEETGTIAERVGLIAAGVISRERGPGGMDQIGRDLRALIEDLDHQKPESVGDVLALLSLTRNLWHVMHEETLRALPAMAEAPPIILAAGHLEKALTSAIEGFEAMTGTTSAFYDWDVPGSWTIDRVPALKS